MQDNKILLVYYTRTGSTGKVAAWLADELDCEMEKIIDPRGRLGLIQYLYCGFCAATRRKMDICDTRNDPSDFDLVVLGTPVWAGNMACHIRTYIDSHKGKFDKVAFFCTFESSGDERTFSEMAQLIGKDPVATLAIKTAEVKSGAFIDKADYFAAKLTNS